MPMPARNAVRAVLPALIIAISYGCGGGSGGSSSQGSTPDPTPAPVTGNRAPTLSDAAAGSAWVDEPFEYQPVASDADGDKLKFTAENLPPWADIDSTTGKISGTPALGDVGEYESITLTVADATHETAGKPFSITVVGSGTGVATLTWEKPVSKVDGSLLDDLAGYHIVYGRSEDDLEHSIFINDPAQTSYEFATLTPGTWYFAVIGVSASGLEGPPTPIAMKSI